MTRTEKITFFKNALGDMYGFLAAHRRDVSAVNELERELDEIQAKVNSGDIPDRMAVKSPWYYSVLKFIGITILK